MDRRARPNSDGAKRQREPNPRAGQGIRGVLVHVLWRARDVYVVQYVRSQGGPAVYACSTCTVICLANEQPRRSRGRDSRPVVIQVRLAIGPCSVC